MGVGVRLASRPVFGKVLLRSRHIHESVLQGLLVRKPFISCTLERKFRFRQGRSGLLELLLGARKTALKRFLLGL